MSVWYAPLAFVAAVFLALCWYVGAYLYRMRGGHGVSLPRPLDQLAVAFLPSIVVPSLALYLNGSYGYVWLFAYGFAMVWAVVWELKGHGGTMDLGTNPKEPDAGRDLETYELLLYPWLYNLVPRYWYDFIGHSFHGLLCTMMSGIFVIACGYELAGVLLVVAGLTKGVAYAIGRKLKGNTEYGEKYTGGARWVIAGLSLLVILWELLEKSTV